jgi:hypothetical protein
MNLTTKSRSCLCLMLAILMIVSSGCSFKGKSGNLFTPTSTPIPESTLNAFRQEYGIGFVDTGEIRTPVIIASTSGEIASPIISNNNSNQIIGAVLLTQKQEKAFVVYTGSDGLPEHAVYDQQWIFYFSNYQEGKADLRILGPNGIDVITNTQVNQTMQDYLKKNAQAYSLDRSGKVFGAMYKYPLVSDFISRDQFIREITSTSFILSLASCGITASKAVAIAPLTAGISLATIGLGCMDLGFKLLSLTGNNLLIDTASAIGFTTLNMDMFECVGKNGIACLQVALGLLSYASEEADQVLMTANSRLSNTNPLPVTHPLKTWQDSDGRWWVENDYYRIELTNASSFIVKTGNGEKNWRVSTFPNWVGGSANSTQGGAYYTFWHWGNNMVDSLEVVESDAAHAVVKIVSHGHKGSIPISVENTLSFAADSPAIQVGSQLLSTGDPYPIMTFAYNFFMAAGGDEQNDWFTWSGGSPVPFPYTSWKTISASAFVPVENDYIHLSVYDTVNRQGIALVAKKSDTADLYTDARYGRAIVEGRVYGWNPHFGIHMDASRTTYFYIYPFTIGDTNSIAPVENFIHQLSKATSQVNPTLPIPTESKFYCPGALPPRLIVGEYAYAIPEPPIPNRVRSGPGLSYSVIGLANPGVKMQVLEGPHCSDNWAWWKVHVIDNDITGWTAEGNNQGYWLAPCPSTGSCP